MRFKKEFQSLLSLTLLLGACLLAFSGETSSDANSNGQVDRETLMAVRGLPLHHKMVGDVMNAFDLKKIRTIREEVHDAEIDGVAQPHAIEVTTQYLAADKTVEFVVKEKQSVNPVYGREPYIDLIRIGLPRAGAAYPFAVSKVQGLTPLQAKEQLRALTLKASRLFPYGITPSMTPERIHQLCDRPYAAGVGVIGKSGNGAIKFFEDPTSPYPITVWFEDGAVSGVDIHTWGPRMDRKDSEQGVSDEGKPSM